jgi:DNA-binding FadR family transcriptional regulator
MIEVFGVLNHYAAASAIARASDEEATSIVEAAERLVRANSVGEAEEKVRAFYRSLLAAAHNPLLEILCKFLAEVQIELANKATGRSMRKWQALLDNLYGPRLALAHAIAARRSKDVETLSRTFQAEAVHNLEYMPQLRQVRLTDRELAGLLGAVTRTLSL